MKTQRINTAEAIGCFAAATFFSMFGLHFSPIFNMFLAGGYTAVGIYLLLIKSYDIRMLRIFKNHSNWQYKHFMQFANDVEKLLDAKDQRIKFLEEKLKRRNRK